VRLGLATGAVILAGVIAGGAYLGGVHVGVAKEQHATYLLRQKARADSIHIVELQKDSVDRALREASRIRDSAAAAQKVKRSAFTIVSDTQLVVIGDTTRYTLPAPAAAVLFSFIRGADAKQSVDSAWLAKITADTVLLAKDRDLWKGRALDAEAELKKERPRFGLKTGIAIGTTFTVLLVKLAAAVVK
jgi:hypothetical protein